MENKKPVSYKDPYWSGVTASAEQEVGIPSGLLHSIINYGERTNADRVSSAGAKTPYQIIPSTRDAFLKKYGIDAYLNDANAAKVAALHLKESLDRNSGDEIAAAGEYHAGPNRKNWGPFTAAYQKRVENGYQTNKIKYLEEKLRDWQEKNPTGSLASTQPKGDESLSPAANYLIQAIQNQGASGAAQAKPSATANAPQPIANTEPETTLSGMAASVSRGALPVLGGAALGGAIGGPAGALAGAGAATLAPIVGDPVVGLINSTFGTNLTKPTVALENAMTAMGIAKPKTGFERVLQTTAAGAVNAGGAAAAGKAFSMAAGQAKPVIQAVGKMIAANPVAQVAGGAGSGFAAQTADELGASTPVQLGASLLGGIAGAKVAGTRIQKPTQQAAQDIVTAEKVGVPLTTSDVLPPETFPAKWIKSTAEKIHFAGTGSVRSTQQAKRIEAVQSLIDDFGAAEKIKPTVEVMEDLAAKRGADLTKYSGMKKDVIERLAQSPVGVAIPKTRSAIDNEINKLLSLNSQENLPIIKRLDDWKNALNGQKIDNVELLRKQIGESFKAPEMASVRKQGEKILSKIYGPLKEDMGNFIKLNGQPKDYTKWQLANARLSEMSGELDMNSFKSVLKKGEATPEVVTSMLLSKKPSEVQQLYSSLRPSGRESARRAIIAHAAEKAVGNVAEGVSYSPDKFANEIKRLGPSVNVFFKGDELDRVKGLARILDITKGAAQASVAPPNGIQSAIPVASAALASFFGGGVNGFMAALGAAGLAGTTARIYESAPVRNLLIKLPKVVPNSPEEGAIVKRLAAAIAAQQKIVTEEQSKEAKK